MARLPQRSELRGRGNTLADSIESLASAINEFPDRLVLLFRRLELQPINTPIEQRFEVVRALAASPCLFDFDVTSQREEIEFCHAERLPIKTILSFHDYQSTPSTARLEEIVERMQSERAAVVKFATMCRSRRDALRLIEFTLLLEEKGLQYIVLGMGEAGKIVRVVSSAWGNFMTFAPATASKASAPGQLTRTQLERILRDLV